MLPTLQLRPASHASPTPGAKSSSAVAAQQPAGVLQQLPVGVIGKQHMSRRQLLQLGRLLHHLDQQRRDFAARHVLAHQQARTGDRRERHSSQQFGVIALTQLRQILPPALVKHELAPGVVLQVSGQGGQQAALIAHHPIGGLPTGASADTTTVFEGHQKFVAQERALRALQRVPLTGLDVIEAGQTLGFDRHIVFQWPWPASSASRYLSASRAAMQPEPAEVMACR